MVYRRWNWLALKRQSKVHIKLCEYFYDLLQYLQKLQALTLLGIINEHINFEVSSRQPISITDDADAVALVGSSQDIAKQINQKEASLGLLEDSMEERLKRALSDSEKVEGEIKMWVQKITSLVLWVTTSLVLHMIALLGYGQWKESSHCELCLAIYLMLIVYNGM